ncbi:MAG: MFS transporter [Elusimicrobia bacterium]|nr:MFS transporter [Elusimicrobiota bacterium]
MSAASSSTASGPGFILRALRYRNYRLFFAGQIVSLIGTWITMTASSWLVYRLSHSAFLLGVVGFAGQIPAFLLSPVAGVYVDRWNRHRLLVLTQILSMLQSFALAILTLSGHVTILAVALLNAFQGIVNAFDMPCRQSFVVAMIEDPNDLGNAIALNSSMVNVARLIGPTAAGLIIAASNEGWCYLIDGFSYIGVIIALLAMRVAAQKAAPHAGKSTMHQLKEGLRYVAGVVPIRAIMILLTVVSLFGVPHGVLIPIFASTILHGGPHTLGFMMSSSGAGAVAGALWLASRRPVVGLGRIIAVTSGIFGASLMVFGGSSKLWLTLLVLPVTGFGLMVSLAACNTVLQTLVDDHLRGRVMSYYMMSFLGAAPIGSLIFGLLAQRIGAPRTVELGGAICVGGALGFGLALPAIRAVARPIMVRKGIIPEVAKGLQSAAQVSIPPED